MTREEILNKLATIVDGQLACRKENVTEDTTFESLGADSLDNLEIVIAIEEEFEIDIDDEQAENIKTVAQAVDHIFSKLSN